MLNLTRPSFAFARMLCLSCALLPPVLNAEAIRALLGGERFGLAITVTPPPGTSAYAVEEELDEGLEVLRIGEGGIWDPYTRKVKWGPFTDDLPRVVSVELLETGGSFTFNGWVAFDSSGALPISGESASLRDDPQTYLEGWLRLNFTDGGPLPDASTVLPGATLPLIAQYAMGLEPGSEENPFRIEAEAETLKLHFQRDKRRNDLNFVLEKSEDLDEWIAIPLDEAQILPLDQDRDKLELELSGPSGFYRLRFDEN